MMNVAIIGSGNVSWHYTQKLLEHSSTFKITIHHRSRLDAVWSQLETFQPTASSKIDEHTDVVIIAVSDHSLPEVVNQYEIPQSASVVHTAGSISLNAINTFHNRGVIYPLQTLKKGYKVENIPLLFESSSEKAKNSIDQLAQKIGTTSSYANSDQRKHIHLAAVFASNFINHQLAIVERLTKEMSLDLELFKPLVKETIRKAFDMGAVNAQTGPALRKDNNTLDAHMALLSDNYEREVYRLLSQGIVSYYK
jgi:predicted short-subunit dehydrogenase-like oxidoreductase (DUF2520 family)